jgi:hypothetical protein
MPFGKGRLLAFGAILPQPTEEFPHPEGLADYAVTIAGGQVLHNALSYRRAARIGIGNGPGLQPPAAPGGGQLPATGGSEPYAAAGLLLLLLVIRRRVATAA